MCMCVAVLMKEGEVKVVPVTQSSYMQKNKLRYLLDKIDKQLGIAEADRSGKWSVDSKKGACHCGNGCGNI